MGTYSSPAMPTVSQGIADTFGNIFHDDLSRMHSLRLQAYRRYWLYYLGRHWTYVRDEGEPTITINYCRAIVDKHVDFTFKKGFSVVIPDDPATTSNEQEDRDFVRFRLEDAWNRNNRMLWMIEAGQQGSVTGDVFARVSWDKTNPLEDPFARVDLIPSHFCFPEFGGPHGVDRKKLTRILIVIPSYRQRPGAPISGAFFTRGTKTTGSAELVIKSEEWTSPQTDDSGKVIVPAQVVYRENNEIIGDAKINPLGEIPVVHIPNYPLSGEYYGMSDLVDIIELNREYNEKTTDISDIVNYHGSPTTVIYGAKLKELEKGSNRMWGLPDKARVENLQLEGDLKAANDHKDSLRSALLELSNTPEHVFGNSQNISNTTGVALQVQYMPMMERRHLKVLTYGYGLRLINRLILRTTEIGDHKFRAKMGVLGDNRYRNQVVFPDPMPQDELRELELARGKIDLGIWTRRRELEKRGFSQAEITAIMDDVKKENQELTESMFELPMPGAGSGNATLQRGGPPEVLGEKIGNTLLKE